MDAARISKNRKVIFFFSFHKGIQSKWLLLFFFTTTTSYLAFIYPKTTGHVGYFRRHSSMRISIPKFYFCFYLNVAYGEKVK